MNLKPTRQTAIENLNTFIEENLEEYSRLRNFDFGPDRRSNTSCLSPYITPVSYTHLTLPTNREV